MTFETRCCIAGGGPAGMMLGVLLARAGIPVVVLEKHARFPPRLSRRYRPSVDARSHRRARRPRRLPRQRPHSELREVRGMIGDERVTIADFSHLPVRCPFIAMVPQWDFLNFLADYGRRYSDLPAADAARKCSS